MRLWAQDLLAAKHALHEGRDLDAQRLRRRCGLTDADVAELYGFTYSEIEGELQTIAESAGKWAQLAPCRPAVLQTCPWERNVLGEGWCLMLRQPLPAPFAAAVGAGAAAAGAGEEQPPAKRSRGVGSGRAAGAAAAQAAEEERRLDAEIAAQRAAIAAMEAALQALSVARGGDAAA